MVCKLGINGFGRIGRIVFRTCLQHNELEVTAINDPAIDAEYICYLIKFDSTHGKFPGTVARRGDNEIIVDGHLIKIFHEKLPACIPWQSANVQYVIESSGMFTSLEKASGHLRSVVVEHVIVTAPSVDIPMLILGVNDCLLSSDKKVLSCASSTLYCLAPIIKILEDKFGVSEGFITSIHAMTPSLKPLDGLCLRGKHWRDHRSIHQNIIPAATGACKALSKIMPQIKDKLTGLAFRVPIVNVSVLDITVRLSKETTLKDIMKCIEEASCNDMKNIVKVTTDDNVSSDFIGDKHSCIVDGNSSLQLKPDFYKIICWYENEFSYACRVVDTILFIENRLKNVSTEFIGSDQPKQSIIEKIDSLKASLENYSKTPLYSKIFNNPTYNKQNIYCLGPVTKSLQRSNLVTTSDKDCKAKCSKGTFNIWRENDTNTKIGVQQYSRSFFHSCVSFATQTNNIKAQERLEKVKKEFTKMANFTEDLLKKSHSNKLDLLPEQIAEDSTSIDVKPTENISIIDDMYNGIESTSKTNSFCASKVGVKINNYKEESNSSIEMGNIDFDIEQSTSIHNSDEEHNNRQCNKTSNIDVKTMKKENYINNPEKDDYSHSETIDFKVNDVIEVQKLTSDKLINDIPLHRATNFTISIEKPTLSNSNESNIEISKNNNFVQTLDTEKTYTDESDRIIVLRSEANSIDMRESKGLKHDKINTNLNENNETVNHLPEAKRPLEPVIVIASKKSTCSEITIATSTYGEFSRNKLDLFDKLDSECGTESNCSFEILARKSQVIHITDLTNSLEDISRLDKICKIIEISDELSDRLFSALDNGEVQTPKRQKWSFKDLCEKIKLDDFCNNIFGKSVV